MQILTRCPRCGTSWWLGDTAADRRIRCPSCRKLFKVPRLDELPKATKKLRQAKASIYVDEEGKTYG